MVSRGSSQVAPLIIASEEQLRMWAGGCAWSDLCRAAVHSEMNCTRANTQLNIDKLKEINMFNVLLTPLTPLKCSP